MIATSTQIQTSRLARTASERMLSMAMSPCSSAPAPRRGRARLGLATAAAALLLVAGCATVPKQSAQQATARASASAEYQGRFSVKYADQTGNVRNAYGNFDWLEQADAVTLSLRNPLGSTLAIVTATPTSATLQLPNRPPRTADNVESLMQDALGFPMPVSGMRYWLKDQPAPGSHAKTQSNAAGLITQIVQDGWRIDYVGFADAPATPSPSNGAAADATGGRPGIVRRMNVIREDAPTDAPLEVRLVIND